MSSSYLRIKIKARLKLEEMDRARKWIVILFTPSSTSCKCYSKAKTKQTGYFSDPKNKPHSFGHLLMRPPKEPTCSIVSNSGKTGDEFSKR